MAAARSGRGIVNATVDECRVRDCVRAELDRWITDSRHHSVTLGWSTYYRSTSLAFNTTHQLVHARLYGFPNR